jgi:LysM repeat protein
VDTNGGSGLGGTGGLVTGIESVTDIVDPGAAAITTYKIKKGDTLAKIANAHGITMKVLNDANPGLDAKKLQIGKELKLPAAKKTTVADAGTAAGGAAVEGTTYTVAKGDTLTGIARKFGVTVPEIRKANGLKTDSIAVGKKLKIPTSAKPATTAATTPTP